MIRVAIETATGLGSVAVGRGDAVLAEVTLGVQTRHAERALPALAVALELAGVLRSEVGEVVVGSGPGSFTGVRVAGAMAKGLVAALDVPLRAYSSLLALAVSAASDRPVCGLFDARRGEVYAGCWRVSRQGIETWMAPRVGGLEGVVAAVDAAREAAGDDPVFVGEGAERYRGELEALGVAVSPTPTWPRASSLIWLAQHHPSGGRVADVPGWQPDYVRASSAEREAAG